MHIGLGGATQLQLLVLVLMLVEVAMIYPLSGVEMRRGYTVVGIEDGELQDGHPSLQRVLVTPQAETEMLDILRRTLLGSFREEDAVR
jgi:hypothetical protein